MSRVAGSDTAARADRRARLLGVLGGLTAVAPLGTDMYVPGLAEVAADLQAPAWAAQLSLTGFLVGIVAGQLVFGPLSDRVGRRPVLLAGAIGFAVVSGLAALTPNVVWFDLARLAQGLCGAAGLVVADLFDDDESARKFATLAAITAAAPIVAPLLGGAVLSLAPWRAVFVVLAVVGLLLALGVAAWVPETRTTPDQATTRAAFADMLALARRRRLVGLVLTLSFGNAAIFAYIAGTSFVFAGDFGFSPVMISIVFGVNAAGNLTGALLFGRMTGRGGTRRAAWSALGVATTSAALLTALAVAGAAPAPIIWATLLVAVAAFGVLFPAVTTEAQNAGRAAPGGASALLGAGQFTLGAAVSPLVGAFNGSGAIPLAAVMAACFVLATAAYLLARRVARP